ncbi:MAG TPA: ABC transporter ATP-binding protein [Actinomycetota bacterium]|nr:ABC transporter ATP-binding protein [Actinomycetota bacterium]
MGTVALDRVTKTYRNGTVAIRSLSLAIADGELFVLLGPSGCGKTTLLRAVAGLEDVTEGRILIAGQDVTELRPKDRDVAMVFQNYALYPHMSVYDNIAFGVQSRRLKKAEVDARVRRVAALLEVDHLLKRKPRMLSGGEQQRVAMGRAIVRDPEVFLMDEPLSNVDARLRLQLRAEIARIQKDVGVTMLYVTHDQTEAMTLGDRVGVMRDGILQQVAAPGDLYRNPRNLFVAGFVGSPPMNLAEATVEEADGDLFVRFSGQRIRAAAATSTPREALRAYAWRQVVVGIRPEDLHLAAAVDAPEGARLRVAIERRETIGPDAYLHFGVDAPLLLGRDPREPHEPIDESWPAERRNVWIARSSTGAGGPGDAVELGIRSGRMLLFDPRTGDVIEG